jgi:hypothetical protein
MLPSPFELKACALRGEAMHDANKLPWPASLFCSPGTAIFEDAIMLAQSTMWVRLLMHAAENRGLNKKEKMARKKRSDDNTRKYNIKKQKLEPQCE